MINKISYLVLKVMLSITWLQRVNGLATPYRKQLRHNRFHSKWRLVEHLIEAILLKKLTQIYHKYLKRPHIGTLFFKFFY